MNLTQTATATTIDRPTLTCSICPFARYLDGNRYVCGVPETAADVVRGHWESKASCHEAIAQTEIPATAPVLATPATLSAKKTAPTLAPTAPAAIGENDEPPNRGDNGRGRVEPIAKTDKALAAMLTRLPRASAPLALASLRMSASDILLSSVSMSALTAGSIGPSAAGVSVVTWTSIAGSVSGVTDADGVVGAVGSGSIASAGVGAAGSRMPIASVANLMSIASLKVPTCDASTWCSIINAVSTWLNYVLHISKVLDGRQAFVRLTC